MIHGHRFFTPILLIALASACSEDDDTSTARNPNLGAGGSAGTASQTGSAGTSSPSSSAPSSAAAGASSIDRPSGGALGNNSGAVGSQGARGGGRFRDRDRVDLDAGVLDGGDVVIDGGDAGDGDAGDVDASTL